MNSTNIPRCVSNSCYACGTGEGTLRLCSHCKSVKYCSEFCQMMHWKHGHKDWCGESTGLRPKCILDKFVTFEGVEKTERNYNRVTDYHAWCVDENNIVHDYPISQLGVDCVFKTDNVVRRPFDVIHSMKALPEFMELLECSEKYNELVKPLSQHEKIEQIKNNTFPMKMCLSRAMALRDSDPRKYAVVIGSLGFVQSDGTIFWEFG